MGIFQRTTDILAANVNDLIDRFEEPERMLRHALREIETLVATTSSAVARSIATEKLLAKALMSIRPRPTSGNRRRRRRSMPVTTCSPAEPSRESWITNKPS